MGTAKASELLLFNKKISAAEAFNRNLITEVIPDGSFVKETTNKVDNFAKLPREVTQRVYLPLLLSLLGICMFFLSSADFFQIQLFEKFFQEYHQSIKHFGYRSGPTFCGAFFPPLPI